MLSLVAPAASCVCTAVRARGCISAVQHVRARSRAVLVHDSAASRCWGATRRALTRGHACCARLRCGSRAGACGAAAWLLAVCTAASAARAACARRPEHVESFLGELAHEPWAPGCAHAHGCAASACARALTACAGGMGRWWLARRGCRTWRSLQALQQRRASALPSDAGACVAAAVSVGVRQHAYSRRVCCMHSWHGPGCLRTAVVVVLGGVSPRAQALQQRRASLGAMPAFLAAVVARLRCTVHGFCACASAACEGGRRASRKLLRPPHQRRANPARRPCTQLPCCSSRAARACARVVMPSVVRRACFLAACSSSHSLALPRTPTTTSQPRRSRQRWQRRGTSWRPQPTRAPAGWWRTSTRPSLSCLAAWRAP